MSSATYRSTRDSRQQKTLPGLAIAVGLVAIAYLALWLVSPLVVFLDLPNHLTRAFIIKELILNNSPFLAQHFSFSACFSPYILGDLLLGTLLELTSPFVGARIWIVLCYFSLPLALAIYGKSINLNRKESLALILVTLYLSSHWFFFSGFLNFSAGISLTFLTLAAWEKLLRAIDKGDRKKAAGHLTWYAIGVLSCYFMHLSAFFFLSIILGIGLLLRIIGRDFKNNILSEKVIKTALPIVIVAVSHISFSLLRGVSSSPFIYRPFLSKFSAVGTMFIRFSMIDDIIFFTLFLLTLINAIGLQDFKKTVWAGRKKEYLIIGATIFAAYLALPLAAFDVYDVDNRGLPFFFLMLSLVAFVPIDDSENQRFRINMSIGGLLLLCVLNLAYLAVNNNREQGHLERYLEVVEQIPKESILLPIATLPDIERIQTSLHLGSYATPIREAISPYLFSANRGDPMPYFRYLSLPPAPHLFWYLRDFEADWSKLLPVYDYLIITKPFNSKRLPLDSLTLTFENETATLYHVNKAMP